MNDMHVHTMHSHDSTETIGAYISCAREKGVGTICFTEHVDFNPDDSGAGYYSHKAFFADFGQAKEKTHGVTLLSGMEFDCPHSYPEKLAEMSRLPYDCIIGSTHYCDLAPGMLFTQLVESGVDAQDCYTAYWNEAAKCAAHGGFDVLGHIDFPKRFLKTLLYNEKKLREIFRTALANGIILEINTSSLRKGCADTMPGHGLLEIYRSEGGRYVTIGSDAHKARDLAADNAAAFTLAKDSGLSEVIFINRKMIIV